MGGISTKVNILVIDDEKAVQLYFKKLLEKEEYYEVDFASNSDEALKKISSDKKYHIAFLDLILDGDNGDKILSDIKKIDDEITVIIITGYPSVETAVNTLKNGAIDYIKKPFENEQIKSLIDKLVRQKGLLADVDDYISKIVGNRLKKLRKLKKMTLKDLSDRIGLSISLCSQIENSKVMPSLLTFYKICRGLDTTLEEITKNI